MKYRAEIYRASPRPYRGLGELRYPFHERTITVTHCGRICPGKRKINLILRAADAGPVGCTPLYRHGMILALAAPMPPERGGGSLETAARLRNCGWAACLPAPGHAPAFSMPADPTSRTHPARFVA